MSVGAGVQQGRWLRAWLGEALRRQGYLELSRHLGVCQLELSDSPHSGPDHQRTASSEPVERPKQCGQKSEKC